MVKFLRPDGTSCAPKKHRRLRKANFHPTKSPHLGQFTSHKAMKGYVSTRAKWPAGAYPSFCRMQRLRAFLFSLDGKLVHRRLLVVATYHGYAPAGWASWLECTRF